MTRCDGPVGGARQVERQAGSSSYARLRLEYYFGTAVLLVAEGFVGGWSFAVRQRMGGDRSGIDVAWLDFLSSSSLEYLLPCAVKRGSSF